MKLSVTVTRDDIRLGKTYDECNCPIARAIKRQYKTKAVCVRGDDGNIDGREVLFPKAAETFIRRFDLGRPVKPFTFLATL